MLGFFVLCLFCFFARYIYFLLENLFRIGHANRKQLKLIINCIDSFISTLHWSIDQSRKQNKFLMVLLFCRRQMPVSIGNQIVIERTRGYFVHKDAPLRISLKIPNARLIVVVRNPVLRSLLDYTSQCVRNKSKVSFLENFFWNNITGFIDMSRDFVQTSMYVKFMENWLSYFKLEQFHFVNGDMLYKNPSLELSKLETFLNLRNMISSDHFFYNTSIDALCIKKYECQGRSRCFTENKLKYRPPSYLVRRLRDFFHPFNEKFYKQTKHHFSWNKMQ